MTKEYIEFKRKRDLGSIITDAFKFLRLEGKGFFTTIFKMAIIPILVAIIAMIYYMQSFSSLTSEGSFEFLGFFIAAIIMLIAYIFAYSFINLAGMYYIKSYIDNKGKVNKEEIVANTKEKIWSFLGFGTIAMLILVVSAMLCFFPVFYTMTALSLGASILVFENQSATDAIGKCFSFIQGHFWETLGVVLVVGILISILGYVFQIPAFIYQMITTFTGIQDNDPTAVFSLFSDPIYLLLNVISILGQLLLYSVTLVTNVFIYFDINEQKNLTGTIEKIDSLGQ